MCGILAILYSQLELTELKQVAFNLSKRIRHRGPDWTGVQGYHTPKGTIALAHELLAIVNLSGGKQPLSDPDNTFHFIVCGEIYNYKRLKDTMLRSKETIECYENCSDSAIIPSLFKYYETSFISKLDGMFAFVGCNEITGRCIAARDPLGICPLYIGWGRDGTINICSELKCLVSMCSHIEIFPPGHYFDSDLIEPNKPFYGFKQYYCPIWSSPNCSIPTGSLDLVRLKDSLEKAVKKRLMGCVPFGVLLSGGLDSSIIALIASKFYGQCPVSQFACEPSTKNKLQSFTIGLKDSPDLLFAREAAHYIGTEHHEHSFTLEEGIFYLKEVIYHLETYDVTTIRAATPLYVLSRMIKSLGFKFILSGEGADEIFGGYLYFHKAPNKDEFFRETQRKLFNLHYYDLLRANKATMAFGLELRVPFLDSEFIDLIMSLDPQLKMCLNGQIEKHILRSAFKNELPDTILWRQKEQFSDGVGYGWIDGLQHYAETQISDIQFGNSTQIFPMNSPTTKEAFYYRLLFEELFQNSSASTTVLGGPSIACSTTEALQWSKEFQLNTDQSGRAVLGIHQSGDTTTIII